MRKNKKRIIAIDPGIRNIGIAIIEDDKLLYHGVKTTAANSNGQKALKEVIKRVAALIVYYRPNMLLYEQAHFNNNKKAYLVNTFIRELEKLAKRKRLRIYSIAPSQVKKTVCGDGWATKKEMALAVAKKYPELRVYLNQARKWKEKHWYNVFDAVGLILFLQSNYSWIAKKD